MFNALSKFVACYVVNKPTSEMTGSAASMEGSTREIVITPFGWFTLGAIITAVGFIIGILINNYIKSKSKKKEQINNTNEIDNEK